MPLNTQSPWEFVPRDSRILDEFLDWDREFDVPSLVGRMESDVPLRIPDSNVVALVQNASMDVPGEFEPGCIVTVDIDPEPYMVKHRIHRIPLGGPVLGFKLPGFGVLGIGPLESGVGALGLRGVRSKLRGTIARGTQVDK